MMTQLYIIEVALQFLFAIIFVLLMAVIKLWDTSIPKQLLYHKCTDGLGWTCLTLPWLSRTLVLLTLMVSYYLRPMMTQLYIIEVALQFLFPIIYVLLMAVIKP
jgi:hypothetical protein